MPDHAGLLRLIGANPNLAVLLADAFEFDTTRNTATESPRLISGLPLTGIAGDFAGGMFFLCGAGEVKPVLYVTSEGAAGIIGADLAEALTLIIGFPYWRDCLTRSEGGKLSAMVASVDFLNAKAKSDRPTIEAEQRVASRLLELSRVPTGILVARLHAAVQSTSPNFSFIDDTGEYGSLFD
ncbi:hypothetical protein ACFYY2_10655 [Streptomyces sp. NPDC001822]|uniref:hypothetical protein n=1 Tax=Streptomyces sp. NPDC001822 TaxID=3364614 RepID=UPI00368DAF27